MSTPLTYFQLQTLKRFIQAWNRHATTSANPGYLSAAEGFTDDTSIGNRRRESLVLIADKLYLNRTKWGFAPNEAGRAAAELIQPPEPAPKGQSVQYTRSTRSAAPHVMPEPAPKGRSVQYTLIYFADNPLTDDLGVQKIIHVETRRKAPRF